MVAADDANGFEDDAEVSAAVVAIAVAVDVGVFTVPLAIGPKGGSRGMRSSSSSTAAAAPPSPPLKKINFLYNGMGYGSHFISTP